MLKTNFFSSCNIISTVKNIFDADEQIRANMKRVQNLCEEIHYGCIVLIDLDSRPLVLVLFHGCLSPYPCIIRKSNRIASRLYLSYHVLKVLTNEIALQYSFFHKNHGASFSSYFIR